MILGLLLSLVTLLPANAAEVPFFLREANGPRDVGGINENSRALADSIRKTDLTNGGSVSGNLEISGSGNGIIFPDGTTQTTASTSVLTSTITAGPVVYSATVTYASVYKNAWTIVASTSVTASGQFSFVNLYSTYTHRVGFRLFQNTSDGILQMRLNSLATGIYDWSSRRETSSGQVSDNGGGDTEIQITGSGLVRATDGIEGEITLRPEATKDIVRTHWLVSYQDSTNTAGFAIGGARASLAAGSPMVSIQIFPSAGTFTGFLWLEAQVPAMGP